ncbi:MAG: alpha-galactosidase, partial [Promethearchaeota archaeon]
DSFDRERNYLAQKRMYRIIAPWITENPIFMHITTADPKKVKAVIDQCAEVGFEMVILSFGSGFNMEWEYPEFYEEYKELFDYAHSKGIEIGGYSLFSSRSIDDENDVIDPATGLPNKHATFGKAPCLCSKWGVDYIRKIKKFFEQTGADFLEHDGPYPGDLCASKTHPGHDGLEDSQWMQWRAQTDLYKWCRAQGIYINAPDWYFLSGSNKTGIGYKEVNWSLPRERQIILARQNIYDGTWDKTPSMGWMFTPLTTYHRVGEWRKSTLEPLEKHLKFFSAHLKQNFLSGVQSCYRGKRLFDSEITKSEIIKWVSLFKKHREILESDIIHLRRPDGVHIDGILHVNPRPKTNNEHGFAVFYNPTKKIIKEKISIPLYYTGLTEYCWASIEDKEERKYKIDRDYKIHIDVEIKPEDLTWVIIKSDICEK